MLCLHRAGLMEPCSVLKITAPIDKALLDEKCQYRLSEKGIDLVMLLT